MALTNQPYIPLYVKDWLTNNKLKVCSIPAHGLLINIMCVLHKEDRYGTLLLKQNFKQSSSMCLNFASYLARLLPFTQEEILPSLEELLNENVLYIDKDSLCCQRMIEDAELSKKRSASGGLGGKSTQKKKDKITNNTPKKFASGFAKANIQANTENENESVYENEDEFASEFLIV